MNDSCFQQISIKEGRETSFHSLLQILDQTNKLLDQPKTGSPESTRKDNPIDILKGHDLFPPVDKINHSLW